MPVYASQCKTIRDWIQVDAGLLGIEYLYYFDMAWMGIEYKSIQVECRIECQCIETECKSMQDYQGLNTN